MKSLVVVFIMIAMTVAYPDREVPVVPPATAVIGPRAGPAAVVGPAALVPGSASVIVTAVVAEPVGAVVAPGVHVPGAVVASHGLVTTNANLDVVIM